jgi:hypothetical protein
LVVVFSVALALQSVILYVSVLASPLFMKHLDVFNGIYSLLDVIGLSTVLMLFRKSVWNKVKWWPLDLCFPRFRLVHIKPFTQGSQEPSSQQPVPQGITHYYLCTNRTESRVCEM